MDNKLIKSKRRVQMHGEVFTPKWIVDKMLNYEYLKDEIHNLDSTFLEPSAGEGIFLVEILKMKLKIVEEHFGNTLDQYENFSLYALSTLYGVELLEDNAQKCVINIYEVFKEEYYKHSLKFNIKMKNNVLSSAKVIISSNIAQGNFLTFKTSENKPIIFSEWCRLNTVSKQTKKIRIRRIEYTLQEILKKENKVESNVLRTPNNSKQLSFFEEENINADYNYIDTSICNVYKEEMEIIETEYL